MKRSEKIKEWTTKNYVCNVIVFFINILIIGGIFMLNLTLNKLTNNAELGVLDFFGELKRPIYFGIMLLLFSSVMFIFYYFFDRNFMIKASNTEMMFLIIEVSIIVNYVFGHYVDIYLRPVTLVALLTTFLASKRVALFNSVLFCIFMFLLDSFAGLKISTEEYIGLIVSISSCLVAVLCVGNAFSRIGLLIKSLLISIYPLFGVLVSFLIGEKLPVPELFNNFASAFCSGPLAVAMFMIILPFFETIFGKLTRFKLAEFTDHKSKIIRRLIEEAPGTFNHSILVSNIAEACATAIGEDALYARTCAYYHDVGKLRRPSYFAENNVGGKSPHDELTPELSTNIIRAHTVDGYNLLIKHNFPKAIADICMEHHGTMPIYFFYDKAKKFTDGEVNIANYCYGGTKPQSKIATIIMIADSSEAASRSLIDRSRENVKKTVDKIIKDRMEMGQFDDCDITLRELRIISNTIVNNITGIYHNRIEYPKFIINDEQKEEVKVIAETSKEKTNE